MLFSPPPCILPQSPPLRSRRWAPSPRAPGSFEFGQVVCVCARCSGGRGSGGGRVASGQRGRAERGKCGAAAGAPSFLSVVLVPRLRHRSGRVGGPEEPRMAARFSLLSCEAAASWPVLVAQEHLFSAQPPGVWPPSSRPLCPRPSHASDTSGCLLRWELRRASLPRSWAPRPDYHPAPGSPRKAAQKLGAQWGQGAQPLLF